MLLAFVVNSFVYFGFANIYSSKIFNFIYFQKQFESGVYQHRILSRYFVIWIYEFLGHFDIDYTIFKLKFINPKSEPKMYISFYLLNTAFIMLSAVIMVIITEIKNFSATFSEKILLISLAILVIALSQFIIVSYDSSGYFFLLLFFFVFIKYFHDKKTVNLIFLSLILIVSTLNRESSALSISFAATIFISQYGLKKKIVFPIAILVFTFILSYFATRIMNNSFTTNDKYLFITNFTLEKNYLGILFWIIFSILTLILSVNKKAFNRILLFYLFATPYILMNFLTGIIYEIRLYLPIFLTAIFTSRLNFKNSKDLRSRLS